VATIDVGVNGDQQPDAPWTFRRVELRFAVRGRNLDRDRVERPVELPVERYCSVLSTIREAASVTYTTLVGRRRPPPRPDA
jgi:putative redox protein